ncbi:MAG: sulfotransferase, partial [Gammaproteobacteria bacterium]|nr:sulfotransferase [Gammaproteobacteria bacterium]
MKHGPDFLCVGAEKSGTTWLYDNIRYHPDIWLPPSPFKELHYFDDKTPNKNLLHLGRFNHGGLIRRYSPLIHSPTIETLRWLWRFNHHNNDSMHWYRSLFTKKDKLCGDITPLYSTMDARGVEYARKVVGSKCKIILIIREPISQSWSSVKMLYRYRNINIRECDTSEIVKEMQSPFMTLKSDYSRMIKLWRTYFDEDMLQIFFFDDLLNDNEAFLSNICQFIG